MLAKKYHIVVIIFKLEQPLYILSLKQILMNVGRILIIVTTHVLIQMEAIIAIVKLDMSL